MPSPSQMPFFAAPENLEALRHYSRILRGIASASESNQIAKSLLQIVELMIANADRFDEYSASNIEWIGSSFMSQVRDFPELSEEKRLELIVPTFTMAFRFLCELEFTQPSEPSFDVRRVGIFVDENLELFDARDRQQITFARYSMPIQVAKKLLNDPSIAEFRRFSQTVEAAKKLKADWDVELNDRQAHVNALKDGLKGVTSSYNFVGLVDGFRQLAAVKIIERRVAFCSLIVLAFLMITPPFVQIFYVLDHIDVVDSKKGVLLYILPTVVAIEVILIYFFRVVLGQFRSVKAQVLQLDLRIALCQFVQSYAEYSAKVKKDDPNALAKFEALVFSSLVPDSEGIPSTFDGAEQLTKLIQSIRGK
ncbi:hypothetical protein [Acidovorax sp. A1169]|uniref:hypothetical protein n=1 Tax=Acidovorax sp. A1169 TaxID=3059524 RepID=UPI002737C321|nr:hypothetical protein [Acidovorax sp. A1169]MDP4073746.1 hypothetical protein [Acidovorax sp. A1169]